MIVLPFPPASLSGHAKGAAWFAKANLTKKLREQACEATKKANIDPPAKTGDIGLLITFYPGSRRGDRTNFAARIKPLIDGIADALGVNDSRFIPTYLYAEPVKDARVVVHIQPSDAVPVGELIKPIVARCIERLERAA